MGWRCLDCDDLPSLPPGFAVATTARATVTGTLRSPRMSARRCRFVPPICARRPSRPCAILTQFRRPKSPMHVKSGRGEGLPCHPQLAPVIPSPPPKRGPNCVPHRMHLRCKQIRTQTGSDDWGCLCFGVCSLFANGGKTSLNRKLDAVGVWFAGRERRHPHATPVRGGLNAGDLLP